MYGNVTTNLGLEGHWNCWRVRQKQSRDAPSSPVSGLEKETEALKSIFVAVCNWPGRRFTPPLPWRKILLSPFMLAIEMGSHLAGCHENLASESGSFSFFSTQVVKPSGKCTKLQRMSLGHLGNRLFAGPYLVSCRRSLGEDVGVKIRGCTGNCRGERILIFLSFAEKLSQSGRYALQLSRLSSSKQEILVGPCGWIGRLKLIRVSMDTKRSLSCFVVKKGPNFGQRRGIKMQQKRTYVNKIH